MHLGPSGPDEWVGRPGDLSPVKGEARDPEAVGGAEDFVHDLIGAIQQTQLNNERRVYRYLGR